MTRTKLVMIEGIMGSGKTSTAQHITDRLRAQGRTADLFLEGDLDHPADYDRVACLTHDAYQSLCEQHPDCAAALQQAVTREGDDWLVPYGKLDQQIPPSLTHKLQQFDIYDGIDLVNHSRLLQASWSQFAERAVDRDVTTVLECCFLQNPMCAFLAKHDAGIEATAHHVLRLAELIEPLHPLLFYYYQPDVRKTVERVCAERPKAWLDFVIQYHTEQEYGNAHRLHGFDGLIEFLQMRQEVELEICKRLPFETVILENDDHDWPRLLALVEAELQARL